MLINKQRIKNIVNRYYQEVYDIQGTTTIKVFEENVGYGMSESKDCIVKITFKAKRMILFEETTYEQEIDEEKLSTIFSYFLEKENHTLKSLKFNKGIDSRIEGYGLGEHLVNYPYFKGTDIEINEKVKKIGEK